MFDSIFMQSEFGISGRTISGEPCPEFREFSGPAFVLSCPDYRVLFRISRLCKFERKTPRHGFIWVWTCPLSVWDLNLGRFEL